MSNPNVNPQTFTLNFNFQGAELPSGGQLPKLPRGAYVCEVTEAKLSEKGEGMNLILTPVLGQTDPATGKALNPAHHRTIRTYVGFPKPNATAADREVKSWLLLYHVCGNRPVDQLKAGPFQGNPFQLFANRPKVGVDYQPDAREQTYTDRNGIEKKGTDDTVWLLTMDQTRDLDQRLRGEASVQPNAGAGQQQAAAAAGAATGGQQAYGQQAGAGFPGQQAGGFPGQQQAGGFPMQQQGGFPGQQAGGFPGQQAGTAGNASGFQPNMGMGGVQPNMGMGGGAAMNGMAGMGQQPMGGGGLAGQLGGFGGQQA